MAHGAHRPQSGKSAPFEAEAGKPPIGLESGLVASGLPSTCSRAGREEMVVSARFEAEVWWPCLSAFSTFSGLRFSSAISRADSEGESRPFNGGRTHTFFAGTLPLSAPASYCEPGRFPRDGLCVSPIATPWYGPGLTEDFASARLEAGEDGMGPTVPFSPPSNREPTERSLPPACSRADLDAASLTRVEDSTPTR